MGLFSLLRVKPEKVDILIITWWVLSSVTVIFTKCIIALKLSWSHIGIDWPVLQSHMISTLISLLWPKAFLPFGQDYDKSEVKENVFHCLRRQETNLLAKILLSNGGATSAPPFSWPHHHQKQTKPGPLLLVLKSTFSVPFAAFLSPQPCHSVVFTVTVLGRVRNPVTSMSPEAHLYSVW